MDTRALVDYQAVSFETSECLDDEFCRTHVATIFNDLLAASATGCKVMQTLFQPYRPMSITLHFAASCEKGSRIAFVDYSWSQRRLIRVVDRISHHVQADGLKVIQTVQLCMLTKLASAKSTLVCYAHF